MLFGSFTSASHLRKDLGEGINIGGSARPELAISVKPCKDAPVRFQNERVAVFARDTGHPGRENFNRGVTIDCISGSQLPF